MSNGQNQPIQRAFRRNTLTSPNRELLERKQASHSRKQGISICFDTAPCRPSALPCGHDQQAVWLLIEHPGGNLSAIAKAVCRTAGKSAVLHALHFFTASQSRKSGNAARCLGKKQRPQRPARAKYSTVLLSNRTEERNKPSRPPERRPGSTQKAYARAAAIKATKPTRLLHANLTNCDVIADL